MSGISLYFEIFFLFVFPCCMFQSVFVLMCLVSVSVCQCVCQALSLAVSVSRWYLSPLLSSSCLVRSRSKSVLSLEFPLVAPSDNLLENSSHVFNNQGCHGDPIIRWGSHQWTWTVRWGSLHAILCSLQSTRINQYISYYCIALLWLTWPLAWAAKYFLNLSSSSSVA